MMAHSNVSPRGTCALESHSLQTPESSPVHKQQLAAKDRLLGPEMSGIWALFYITKAVASRIQSLATKRSFLSFYILTIIMSSREITPVAVET